MEWLIGSRIALTPRPLQRRSAALEVGMLGHCPGRTRVHRLLALRPALEEIRGAGYGARVDELLNGATDELFHLPIPLQSSSEFHDIFPDAVNIPAMYRSILAGKRAWLAQAVDDFFANGGTKLWLVRVPEDDSQNDFLPAPNSRPHDIDSLQGLATLLTIPSLAVIALPDLERLQIPARLPDIARVRLQNPDPHFLPCSEHPDDGHRERRYSSEIPEQPEPHSLETLLPRILSHIARYRPDVQCLLTLPPAYSGETGSPTIDEQSLQAITNIRDSGGGYLLRHMQFLFPYMRGPRFSLQSPVGLIAGQQASVAQQTGPWRSMAARPLRTDALPYPHISVAESIRLREQPGISIIMNRSSSISLDDERIVVPALHPGDYAHSQNLQRFDSYRSAEVMRFLGFLRRQLQALGEQLVFNIDFRDPRPRLLLEQFLRRLHSQGALRGTLPEHSYQITETHHQEGGMLYEIMVAPAFPIDRLTLTFSNLDGQWKPEISDV